MLSRKAAVLFGLGGLGAFPNFLLRHFDVDQLDLFIKESVCEARRPVEGNRDFYATSVGNNAHGDGPAGLWIDIVLAENAIPGVRTHPQASAPMERFHVPSIGIARGCGELDVSDC